MQINENYDREEVVQGSSNRAFGLVFGFVFLLVALWPLFSAGQVRWWSLGLSAAFTILAVIWPSALQSLNRLWMKLGILLSRIFNPIFLGIIFFGVVTPIGLLMRLFGKNTLDLTWDRKAKSYWIEREPPGPERKSLIHPF